MDGAGQKVSSSPNTQASRSRLDSDPKSSKHSQPAVPRFASFKPSQTRLNPEDEDTATLRTSGSKLSQKGDGRHLEARPERQRRHRHEKRSRKERSEKDRHKSPSPSGPGYLNREDAAHFIEDKKSDESNVRYGTSSRYTVPKYREAGQYSLLGLARHFKTTPELEPGRRLITTELFGSTSRHGARPLRTSSLKEGSVARVVAHKRTDAEDDARRNYLPLSSRSGRKRRKLNELRSPTNRPSESLQQDNNAYDSDKSGGGPDLDSLPASSDVESDSASGSTFPSAEANAARERYAQLSRLVDENPADVNAWLALIQHQDVLLAEGGEGFQQASSNAQKRGLADVKLSIYVKALSKTNGHPLQDKLVHGMMREGAQVWDTSKLAKEWKANMKAHPKSLGLWVQYLTFRMTNFVTFSYESCRDVFQEALDMISSQQISTELESIRIYVFLRMTMFMREAGFSEHAHALWQAILEYCFFEPGSDQANTELFSFEDFWDSEVPRLGEEGARGWKRSERVELETRSDPILPTMTDRNIFSLWAMEEECRMSSSILPARTLDEVEGDDPYRVILFSDIKPFLFRPSGEQARKQLLEAFLRFCGLPPLGWEIGGLQFPCEDPFLNNPFLDPSHTTLDEWLVSVEENEAYAFPMPSFAMDSLALWVSSKSCFSPWTALQSVPPNRRRSEWVQRSLRQLLTAFPNDELLAEYILAVESQIDVKQARKIAKSLLKQQSSLRLYNAFALLEWKTGNSEAAERVWSTALSMLPSFSETSQQDIVLIWRSWLWALLDRQDFPRALRLSLAIPDGKVVLADLDEPGMQYLEEHPISKLRAHQSLSSLLNQHLSLHKADLSIHYLDTLALLTYLTSGQNLTTSLSHYTTPAAHPIITRSPRSLSLLHQSRARLLHLHAQSSPSGFRPSDITAPLTESIRLFPSNTILLSLHHFHTRRSLLTDRIRSSIPPTNKQSSNPTQPLPYSESTIIPPLFHLWTALHRPTFSGSTSHSIRAAFETALLSPTSDISSSSSSCPHNPTLWKLYLLWELHVASKSTINPTNPPPSNNHPPHPAAMAKAITVLHRGIRACPWSKDLVLLAFRVRELSEALPLAELAALYEGLGGRGLRVCGEIEGAAVEG